MYCQFCGTEATHELNYCKRCGGSLNPLVGAEETRPPAVIPTGAVWGMGFTTFMIVVFGLIALLNNLFYLADRISNPPTIAFIALFGTLAILGSVGMLTWLWSRMLTSAKRSDYSPAQLKRAPTSELNSARMGALSDHIPTSVTEHATRTFERQR